jgi:hypothetical protein
MVTKDHPFIKLVLGNIMHVTGIDGYCSIMNDGFIRPNLGEHQRTWNGKDCYYCQKREAISLLDLRRTPATKLIEEYDNWKDVLSGHYHEPAIVFILELKELESNIMAIPSFNEVLADKTLFLWEAEACYHGTIPTSCISKILITHGSMDKFEDTAHSYLTEDVRVRLKVEKETAEFKREAAKLKPVVIKR